MIVVRVSLISILLSLCLGQGPVTESITDADLVRFKALAEKSLSDPQDLQSTFYASATLALLDATSANAKTACAFAKTKSAGLDDLQNIYFTSGIDKALKCQIGGTAFAAKVKSIAQAGTGAADIFYGVSAGTNWGQTIASPDGLVKNVGAQAALAEATIVNQVYAVQIAARLAKGAAHQEIFSLIEDIVGQADEVNEKYLHLEGGLGVTSLFIEGAFSLAAKMNKAPQILQNKLQQFTTYILSRRDSQNVKNVYFVLLASKALSNNKFLVPISVTLASQKTVTGKVQIRVATVLGSALPGLSAVTAEQVNRPSTGVVIISKEALKPVAADKTLFELDILKLKPEAGFYSIQLSVTATPVKAPPPAAAGAPAAAAAAEAKLIGVGPAQAKIEVKVTSEVKVVNMNLAVLDTESTSTEGRLHPVAHPAALKNTLQADSSQKVLASFEIKDKASGKDFEPHQVFMRLLHKESDQEVFFVCEKQNNKNTYEFELNLRASEKVLKGLSGDYEMNLIVGDAVITNSFIWTVGKVAISFYDSKPYSPPNFLADYKPKPLIKHTFREPEKRPSVVISQLFAVLAFLPLLALFGVWSQLGINISNFTIDLPTIGFHGGLASIFGLYYCYFAYLNMFQTLKVLAVLGFVTFLAGHKLLKRLANNRIRNKPPGSKKDE
jgi:oligosaccharyltransferase complex subunit delta (ribophorin II)